MSVRCFRVFPEALDPCFACFTLSRSSPCNTYQCSFTFALVDVGGSPSSVVCWSKGDIGGAKRPEGNQRGGVASVSWVIIDMVVLTCMSVSK